MASVKTRDTAKGRRYDVRYRVPSGAVRNKTFRTKKEAERFAATTEADKARGGLVDPRAGQVTFEEYAKRWVATRPNLRPRSREMYESILKVHVLPTFGDSALSAITPARVRSWHAGLVDGPSPAESGSSGHNSARKFSHRSGSGASAS